MRMWAVVSILGGPGGDLGFHLSGVSGMGCICTATWGPAVGAMGCICTATWWRPGGQSVRGVGCICTSMAIWGRPGGPVVDMGCICSATSGRLGGPAVGDTWSLYRLSLLGVCISGFHLLFYLVFVPEEREEEGKGREERRNRKLDLLQILTSPA